MKDTAKKTLKLFKCVDHNSHFAAPVASIIIAEDQKKAHDLLLAALREKGIPDAPFSLVEVERKPAAHILADGDV